jgi:hypothetical protein
MALTLRKPVAWITSLGQYIGTLNIILMSFALGYILLFLVLAIIRISYPFELEWIEGAYIDEARWIALGRFPYPPPTIHYIPTSKTPFFFYLAALLMNWFGTGFLAARLISVLATLGCFFLLFRLVWDEGKLLLPAVVSVGLYAASYRFSGAWMDIAKTDSLFLFLVLFAFYLNRKYQNWWGYILSGGVFVLAYFTKQLTLPIIMMLAPVSLLVRRGRNWLTWLFAGTLGFAIFFYFDQVSNGWFSFYTFDIVTSHGKAVDYFLFWEKLIPVLLPSLFLAGYYAYIVLKSSQISPLNLPARKWENIGLGAALLLTSWSIYIKTWTYDNAMMMASLGLAFLSGLAMVEVHKHYLRKQVNQDNRSAWLGGSTLLLLLQFLFLFYNPVHQLPTQADRMAGQSFIKRLEGLPGEVLLFNHGFLNYQAGKSTYLHSAPYSDMVSGFDWNAISETQKRKAQVRETLNQAIRDQIFDWVILDQPEKNWTPFYLYVEDLAKVPEVFYPVTGVPTRPESLLIKNPIPMGGVLPLQDERYNSFFVEGWSDSQDRGRWVVADRAMVHISLEKHDYLVQIRARVMCQDNQPVADRLLIGWNDHVYSETKLAGCDAATFEINLPKEKIANGLNDLWLEFPRGKGNDEAGINHPEIPYAAVDSIEFTQD